MLARRIERARRRGRAPTRSSTARRCSRCRRRSRTCTSTRASAATSSTLVAATRESPSVAVGSSPRGSARPAQARRAAGPRSPAGTSSRRTTSRRVAVPALAHRLVLKPELWVQRRTRRGRRPRGARPGPDAARRGRRAARVTRRRRRASPATRRSPALGLVAALALRRAGARVARRAVRARSSRSGSSDRAAPASAPGSTVDVERALEGDELDATLDAPRRQTAVDRLEVGLALPDGSSSSRPRCRSRSTSLPGEERELPLRLRCDALGRPSSVGDVRLRARDRLGLVSLGGARRPPHAAAGLPAPGAAATPRLARSTRRPRPAARSRALPGGRARVRRHCARSSPATACARSTGAPAPGAASSSSTSATRSATRTSSLFLDSFAEARTPTAGTLEHAVRAAATLASALPRAPRPRRARRVRRHPALARAGWRAGPALPPRRRPARDRGRVHLRVEGRQRDPGADAAAARARHRRHPAARRPRSIAALLDLRGARARPRRGRDLAGADLATPGASELDGARAPALAAAAGRAARAVRAARRRRRALDDDSRSTPRSRG